MELRRYADVAAALHDPSLSPNPHTTAEAERAHLQVREAVRDSFSTASLNVLRADAEALAEAMLARLPNDRPVDLVRDFAEPWSLAVAMRATGAAGDAELLLGNARLVFRAAASPDDAELQAPARAAAAELARILQGPGGSGEVQAFVALSQTLPCFLGNAWHALTEHPGEADLLSSGECTMQQAIEELLRYAGPSRVLFRYRGNGERVALLIAEANRDPEQFADPNRLDFTRDASGHLALGAGTHSCAGAALIRMAASIATGALLARGHIEPAGPVEWKGGYAIRGAASLPVLFRSAKTGRNVLIEKS